MTTRTKIIALLFASVPASSFALSVSVTAIDIPRWEDVNNSVRAAIAVEGDNLFIFSLAGGFTLSCPFSSTVIQEHKQANYSPLTGTLFVPGPSTALGSWQMDGYATMESGCRICTLTYKGAIDNGFSAQLSGAGGGISFGTGSVSTSHTQTFQVCKGVAQNCDE
jgi:hypothetical protein